MAPNPAPLTLHHYDHTESVDGHTAICSCGFRSGPHPTREEAEDAWDGHRHVMYELHKLRLIRFKNGRRWHIVKDGHNAPVTECGAEPTGKFGMNRLAWEPRVALASEQTCQSCIEAREPQQTFPG